jgi:hypothetical protein
MENKLICISCEEEINENEDMLSKDGDPICERCYYEEPIATVYYSDEGDYPHIIGYYRDDTDGDFSVEYHRIDGWRGYYEVVPSDDWANVRHDCALAHSQDEQNLKSFDDALREALTSMEISYARVFTVTSNAFSTGYDFFVESKHEAKVKEIVEVLEDIYRDPWAFRMTALTGKNPENCDNKDHLFLAMLANIVLTSSKTEV